MKIKKRMLSHKKSLNILKRTKALLDGHFVLSSGLHSPSYIQCAKLLSFPKKAEIICTSLTEKIKKNFNKIDIVLSPAIGGVVVGYEIGRHLGVQSIYAERVDGKLTLRRGFSIPKNYNVLIVEDVITTGGSAIQAVKRLRDAGYKVERVVSIVDRQEDGEADTAMKMAGLELHSIFKLEELVDGKDESGN